VKQLKVVIGALAVFGAMFALGYGWRDLQTGKLPKMQAMTTLLGVSKDGKNLEPADQFEQIFRKISSDYIRPVEAKKLKYAAMGGLIASLGDPHTVFMEPKEAQAFSLETRANFVGVGARLAPDPLGAKVVVVFDDGPAFKAGLKPGDTITAVDNQTCAGKEIDAIVSSIRGEQGTQVKLTVIRANHDKPIDINCRRARIITPTVEGRMVEGEKIGYLSVAQFAEPTTDQFDKVLDKLSEQGMKGLVIDLRGNPGGLLDVAKDMLSRFVERKVVVKMKGRRGAEEVVTTNGGETRFGAMPVVVLMNEESASASEIFAGVLQDYRRATIVGDHSYGKASVQNVIPLIDSASVKLTIARYFLPSGRDISRKVDEDQQYLSGGLQPDVKVTLDPAAEIILGDVKTDTQLQKALELIRNKM